MGTRAKGVDRLQHWRERAARWHWLVVAIGAALYALRIGLEATPQRPLIGAVAAVACLPIVYGLHAWAPSTSLLPLGLLWVYVLWPAASPAMALGIGFVALAATLIRNLDGRRVPALVADGLVLIGALALYVATLAPTVLPADSGEFQIVGPLLGVAHPPGYALFTLLARLFSLIPVGEVAWRLNLMGAVTGAVTLVVVARTARTIVGGLSRRNGATDARPSGTEGGAVWAGIAAASALGVSTTYWAQSTTTNIRMLTMLFTALCLYFLIRFLSLPPASRQGVHALTGLAVSFGLAVAHTAWPAFFAPLFGAVILWHDPGVLRRVGQWPRYLLGFALPFLANLYIVLRAVTGAPFGTQELVDAGRVIDHLLGRGFGGDMFAYLKLDRFLWERFLVTGNIYYFQFGGLLLLLAALGWIWLARNRVKVAVLLGGLFATMTFIVATYRAPQSVEYLMPAYIPIALCIGSLVAWASQLSIRSISQSLNPLLAAALLLPVLFLAQANLPSYLWLHHDRSAREYAESVLDEAPPDAHVLSNWHWYTPLRYLQLIEGARPDVQVSYVYPQGANAMPQAWPQRIVYELQTSERPLIVTNYYPTYRDLLVRFEPLGNAFLARPGPSWEVPAHLTHVGPAGMGVDFTEGGQDVIRIIGYRIRNEDLVRPGDQVTVDLIWQPLVPLERGYAFFVHLIGAGGVPLGQQDHRHDGAASYEPGEVRVDRYRFPVSLAAAPGSYSLVAGIYVPADDGSWQRLTTRDGRDTLTLDTVSIAPALLPPVTRHAGYVPFADGPTLVGLDYDDTLPEQRRVYMHWRASDRPALAQLYAGGRVIASGPVPGRGEAPGPDDSSGRAADGGTRGRYVTTVLDVPPGTKGMRVALAPVEGGGVLPARGAWGIRRATPISLPRPRSRQHYLPFGGKLALVDGHAQDTWTVGEQERVALHFLGLRPIVLDYVVSVGIEGQIATDAPSDWVPALGAMPAFKWVRGSLVNDVHLIRVHGGSGEAELTLGVYDAFTSQALPPLDERIARQGRAGVLLGRIRVP